jgi:hypothetical protein
MVDEMLKSDPTYRWCQRKTGDGICGWGQLHPLGGDIASMGEIVVVSTR